MADGTTGSMVSREVGGVPKDEAAFRVWIEKTLKQHYQDIKTLFDTCTDCDRVEKIIREASQL